MNTTDTTNKIVETIQASKDVLVVTHEHPTGDSMGATLALYLALQSLGKKVTVASPDAVTVEHSSFIGANKLVTEIGKKNFIISLDYTEGSIEKVSYNIEGNKFNLVIEPRPGFDFSQDKAHFSSAGASADCIIAIDTIHLGGLKKLFEAEKDLFATKPVLNIDRHPNNGQFGAVNFVDPQASSTVELVYQVILALGVTLNQDMASNLLNGLYQATNNFTNPNVTALSFDIAAACTKAGGRRFRRVLPTISEEIPDQEEAMTMSPEMSHPQPMASTVPTQKVIGKTPNSQPAPQEAPSDWLKPKIFKSSQLG